MSGSGGRNFPTRNGGWNGNRGRGVSNGFRRPNDVSNDGRRGNWHGPNSRQDFSETNNNNNHNQNNNHNNNNNIQHLGRGTHHSRPSGFYGNGPPNWPSQQRFQNSVTTNSDFENAFPGLSPHLFNQAFPPSFPNGGNQPSGGFPPPGTVPIYNASNNPPMQFPRCNGFPNTVPPFNQPPFNRTPFNSPPFSPPPLNTPPFNTPPFSPPPFSPPPFSPPSCNQHQLFLSPFNNLPPSTQQQCTQPGCSLPICIRPECIQQLIMVPCNQLLYIQLPADQPPADQRPADQPPADQPPADQPPADQPPSDQPPCLLPPHSVNQDTTYYSLAAQQRRLQVVYSDETHVTLQSATETVRFTRAEVLATFLQGICRCQCGILNKDVLDRMTNMEAELAGFPGQQSLLMAINAMLWTDNSSLLRDLQIMRSNARGQGGIGDVGAATEGSAAAIQPEENEEAAEPKENETAIEPKEGAAAIEPEGNAAVMEEHSAAVEENESEIDQEDTVVNKARSSNEEYTVHRPNSNSFLIDNVSGVDVLGPSS